MALQKRKSMFKLHKKTSVSKDECPYYILKNNEIVDTYQLQLVELLYVGLANNLKSFAGIISSTQGIQTYTDLLSVFEFWKKNNTKYVNKKLPKIIKALDRKSLFQHAVGFSKLSNSYSIESIVTQLSNSEKSCIKLAKLNQQL